TIARHARRSDSWSEIVRCRIRIKLSQPKRSSPSPIFGLCVAGQERRWRGGTGSVLAHILVGAAIFGLSPQPEFIKLLGPSSESLMLRVPEPLYLPRDLSGRGDSSSAGASP